MKTILFLVFILTTVKAQLLTEDLSFEAYRSANDIVEHFPAGENVIIHLGNTTNLTSAYMQEMEAAGELPVGYSRDVPVNNMKPFFNYEDKEAIMRFIKRIIPHSSELNGKKIVFNRALHSAVTMSEFIEYMDEYISKFDPDLKYSVNFTTSIWAINDAIKKAIKRSSMLVSPRLVYNTYFATRSARRRSINPSSVQRAIELSVDRWSRYRPVTASRIGYGGHDFEFKENPHYKKAQDAAKKGRETFSIKKNYIFRCFKSYINLL